MAGQSYVSLAEELIRATGDRATEPRIRVFAYLLAQQHAVAHHQIESALGKQQKIDRVTLYRILDWLAEKGLIHKIVGDDRVWRFMLNSLTETAHRHAHFQCNKCNAVTCLDETRMDRRTVPLPKGFQGQDIEVTVKGLCPRCH